MNLFSKPLLITFLTFTMASCGSTTTLFTQQLRDQYKLSADDLKSIQFYVSGEITLTRYSQGAKKSTEDGELTLMKDEVLERVVIKSGTPCLIRDVVDGNRVTVSFENGNDRYLVFGSLYNRDGAYTLQALNWKKDNGGRLNYGQKEYEASYDSKGAFLYLKVKSLNKFRLDQEVVKGKTLK